VNRNRILVHGAPQWITMPVAKANHMLPINRREYLLDDRLAVGIVRRIEAAYRRAPFFSDTIDTVTRVFHCRTTNVAEFNAHLLRTIAGRLEVATPMRFASTVPNRLPRRGREMVIDICHQVGASTYVNPIGGLDLYDEADFTRSGITLRFLQPNVPPYAQWGASHVPSLSIIDALMFNGIDAMQQIVKNHRLTCKAAAAAQTASGDERAS
jgi:hypothetical protein